MVTNITEADVNDLSALHAQVEKLFEAVADRRLHRTHLRILARLNEAGLISTDRVELAETLGLSPTSVSNALSELRRYGYLEVLRRVYIGPDFDNIDALVWDKTDGHCFYCHVKLHPFRRRSAQGFHVEHQIPRSAGGSDEIENLVPACSRCNLSKGARTPEQWGGPSNKEAA